MIASRIGFWLSVILAALTFFWTAFDILGGTFSLSPGFIDRSHPQHIQWALTVVKTRHWMIPAMLFLAVLSAFCCWKMGQRKPPLIAIFILLIGVCLAASAIPLAYLTLYTNSPIGSTHYTDTDFRRSLLPACVYFLTAVTPLTISGGAYLIARRAQSTGI